MRGDVFGGRGALLTTRRSNLQAASAACGPLCTSLAYKLITIHADNNTRPADNWSTFSNAIVAALFLPRSSTIEILPIFP